MKKLIAGACALLTSSIMAMSIQITVDATGKSYYENQGNNSFVKSYGLVTGKAVVKVSERGQVLANQAQDINEREDSKGLKMIEVLNKSTIRLVDQEIDQQGHQSDINAIVNAKIKTKLGGKLKSIKIEKEELLALYKDELERSGINQLRNLNINTDEVKLSTKIEMSDMECSNDKDRLVCEDRIVLTIKASDE